MEELKKLILIIDDDKDLREIITLKLQQAGFNVEQASDGEGGIEKAKQIKPNLVLLDVRMPGMSGIQTLAKLKADPELADQKVIFLTNLGEADEENSWIDDKFAKDAGALGHIKKTDDLSKIVERVKEVFANL
jgi:CheY-like chemotaxis protein